MQTETLLSRTRVCAHLAAMAPHHQTGLHVVGPPGGREEDADGLRAGNRSTFFSGHQLVSSEIFTKHFLCVKLCSKLWAHSREKDQTAGPQGAYALLGKLKLIQNAKTKNSSSNWGKKEKKMQSTLYARE